MKSFPFKKIDAFATSRSAGNPAGYIVLESQAALSTVEKLRIAGELRGFVNEVGFVSKSTGGEYELTYYSAEREVDFCGHATIAITYDLINSNPGLLASDTMKIVTKKGALLVRNRIADEDSVFIMSPEPVENKSTPGREIIEKHLKAGPGSICHDLPISNINAGLSTLIVPVANLDTILGISPDLHELKDFCVSSGVDIIEIFTTETVSGSHSYRARVFAPTYGYLEDPATGSGNSAFGYYLMRNGMWADDSTLLIEQNAHREEYNIVKLIRRYEAESGERVYFGGRGVTRIEGYYLLQ